MEEIIIRIRDRRKAQTLIDFLKSLDYVETVTKKELSGVSDSNRPDEENEFFGMAGLWEGRDISLKAIREQVWPYRA